MSLWTKTMTEVTFEDVAEFCAIDWPEGARLDYKQDIPNDLAKSVAAFANTLGGLIVFGVEVDRTTNKPKWPPIGMKDTKGFSERIIKICAANIHPPIMPTIAGPLSDPNDKTKFVAVLRVDQSLAAPHAIQNKTQICVRVGDTTERFEFADIDRIESLLRRRTESSQLADLVLKTHFERIENFMPDSKLLQWAWSRIVPAYVWEPICQPEDCRDADFRTLHGAPNGAFAFHETDGSKPNDYRAIRAEGDIFRARLLRRIPLAGGIGISLGNLSYEAMRTFESAQKFLRRNEVSYPGILRLSIGLNNVRSVFMQWGDIQISHVPFPDKSMTAEVVAPYEEFDESDFSTNQSPVTIPDLAHRLLSQLSHAFSIGEIPKKLGL